MNNKKFNSDKELFEHIYDLISKSTISVDHAPNEPVKQYILYLSNDDILTFSQSLVIEAKRKEPYIEYCIDINGNEIVTIYTKPYNTVLSPVEKLVVDAFRKCSNKLIAQEAQSLLRSVLGANTNQKFH